MSGYDVEHNVQQQERERPTQRRPDLSTFFSTVDQTQSAPNRTLPMPSMVAAAFRQLANAYQVQLGETEGVAGNEGIRTDPDNHLLQDMVNLLMSQADNPPDEVAGMPESFFDELERVPKSKLKPDQVCPLCLNPYLEDKYPLVVRLPCHKDHTFDLECIRPWLKVQTTCPMDRKSLAKPKPAPKPAPEDEEEDYDDMYA